MIKLCSTLCTLTIRNLRIIISNKNCNIIIINNYCKKTQMYIYLNVKLIYNVWDSQENEFSYPWNNVYNYNMKKIKVTKTTILVNHR